MSENVELKSKEALPPWASNESIAEFISAHLFPVSPVTVRGWEIVRKKFVNGKSLRNRDEAIGYALQLLAIAPENGPTPKNPGRKPKTP
jgi:hypothetical protein